ATVRAGGDGTARAVALLDRRRARAGVRIASRTRDERHVVRGEPREILTGHLYAVHRHHAPTEKSLLGEIGDRADARRDPVGIPRAEIFEQAPPGALAGADEFDFLSRLREVHAARRQSVLIDRLRDV